MSDLRSIVGGRRLWSVLAVGAVAWLALLVVVIARDPPDTTLTARVSAVDLHRLCLRGSPERCLENERPAQLTGIEPGACVRVRFSDERVLVSVEASERCP